MSIFKVMVTYVVYAVIMCLSFCHMPVLYQNV